MNLKTWIPLVLAVVLGLVAMKVAKDMMAKNPGPAKDSGSQIVVLNKDLSPGAAIAAEDLTTAKVPGALSLAAVFTNPEELQGRVLTSSGAKGAPVLETMLAPKGTGSGLQSLIPDGMRAITIEINEFTGVAGNITPGSRVDVVATINGESGEMLTRTIVQNVKVQSLGIRGGTQSSDPPPPARSITLLASPKEAETIELAISTGKTRLLLRGANDNEPAGTEGVTFAELRRNSSGNVGGEDPFAVRPAEFVKPLPQPTVEPSTRPIQANQKHIGRQIKIIRGGVESEVTVPEREVPSGIRLMTGTDPAEVPAVNQEN